MDNNKYLEKKIRRYVVVNVNDGTYLKKTPGKKQYEFTKNIIRATKTSKRSEAYFLVGIYKDDVGIDADLLTIIPLDISYELIQECVSDYDYELDCTNEILLFSKHRKRVHNG